MSNDYTSSLNVAGSDTLLAPETALVITDTSEASATTHAINITDFYLENTAKISFKVFMPNGWSNAFTLNVSETGAKSVKMYSEGSKAAIPSSGAAGTVLEMFYDGTDYIVFRGI